VTQPKVLITGASTGIGAVYADRFAKRGHDLVLVARDAGRLLDVAEQVRGRHGVQAEILQADLNNAADLIRVEARLTSDVTIGTLINNAGTAAPGTFVEQSGDALTQLIGLNATAVTRLARAAAARFVTEGRGAIVNIGSIVGLAPELGMAVYGATKAFVLYLSQGLALELGPKGIYVQAVLPAATRTEIWKHAGRDVSTLPGLMEVDELVDAALVGFDRREAVTIPPLAELEGWTDLDQARKGLLPKFLQSHAAPRYRAAG
jgi:uncharacterized protein